MPSDDATLQADARALRAVLEPAGKAFRSALARTIEEVRTFLDARETSEEEHVADAQASLGQFAAGRIDPARFSALQARTLGLDASAAQRVAAALETLKDLNARLESLVEVRVPSGGSLADCVDARLAEIGRAFGAAHMIHQVRAGSFDEARHGALLERHPFRRWTAAERALAPPLVVEVAGADCQAGGLGAFLDGGLKLVLRVQAPAPVAPLARLIAPRTLVVQAAAPAGLAGLAGWKGSAVAALVPDGCARFCWSPGQPLEVGALPEGTPRPVGGTSSAQQQEDLELLQAWGEGVPKAAEAARSAGAEDPAGKLATWLLRQARLDGTH